jgi:hypothetical protein
MNILPKLGRIVPVLLCQEVTPLTRWALQRLLQTLRQGLTGVGQPTVPFLIVSLDVASRFQLFFGQERQQ